MCVCFDVVTGWALCRLHGKSYIMFSGFGFGSKRLGLRVENVCAAFRCSSVFECIMVVKGAQNLI